MASCSCPVKLFVGLDIVFLYAITIDMDKTKGELCIGMMGCSRYFDKGCGLCKLLLNE